MQAAEDRKGLEKMSFSNVSIVLKAEMPPDTVYLLKEPLSSSNLRYFHGFGSTHLSCYTDLKS